MALQLEQEQAVKRHPVTLDEYDRMVEAGVFTPEAEVELIRGEIVDMPPTGPEHEAIVARLDRIFNKLVLDGALVWPQGNSIGLPQSKSRPQPDVTLLRWRDDYYANQRPRPEDVILLIEVSDSTLKFDRSEKLQLYAEAGIRDYWVINLVEGIVEVYTEPVDSKYRNARKALPSETLQLPGALNAEIAVSDILGQGSKG